MKTKKITVWAAIISIAVIVIIIPVFATSANIVERDEQESADIVGEDTTPSSGSVNNANNADSYVPDDGWEASLGSCYIQDAQNESRDPETTVEPVGTEYTGEIDGINLSEYIEEYVTLTDDTEIERWEILNHNGENILRIRVEYNQDDLLIYLGDGRYSPHYCAFIYKNGQYRYEKSFEVD